MPGFKLRRANQTVAIDSDYFNLAMRQAGTVRTSSSGQTNPYVRKVEFIVNAEQPIIAFRSPYPVCITNSQANGNGTVTYYLWGFADGDFDFDVQFWLFDLPEYGMSFTTAGKMIVRNPASGQVVFDSRMKYLKVQDFFSGGNGGDGTRSYGKYPAVVLVNRAWAVFQVMMTQGQTRQESLTSAAWTDGNDVKVGSKNIFYMVRPQTSSDRNYNYSGGTAQTMVIDVENY